MLRVGDQIDNAMGVSTVLTKKRQQEEPDRVRGVNLHCGMSLMQRASWAHGYAKG